MKIARAVIAPVLLILATAPAQAVPARLQAGEDKAGKRPEPRGPRDDKGVANPPAAEPPTGGPPVDAPPNAQSPERPVTPAPDRERAADTSRASADEAAPQGPEAVELGPAGAPVVGERVAADVGSGEVRVQLPGSDAFVRLSELATMPVGSLIDARKGEVALTVALPGNRIDRATFGGGMFVVRLNARDGVTELRLRGGSYERCSRHALTLKGAKRKRRTIRRLWGEDRGGRFRTHGHNSIATVRGTRWLTVERCDGTLTRVTEGAVEVRNRRNGRRVLIRAGESYLAKRR